MMMWTPRGLSTPRTLASAPTTTKPRSHFLRRSLSFESGAMSGAHRRAAERDEDLVGLPPLPPTFDQDWHEQLQGRLAALDTALVPEKPRPVARSQVGAPPAEFLSNFELALIRQLLGRLRLQYSSARV